MLLDCLRLSSGSHSTLVQQTCRMTIWLPMEDRMALILNYDKLC